MTTLDPQPVHRPKDAPGWRPRATVAAAYAAPAVFLAALYARVLFRGETFVGRDWLRLVVPSRDFLAAALAGGRLPEWNDRIGFGVPFAANPIHGLHSPLSWLLALGPTIRAYDLHALAHLYLLALGTALLCRRLGADRAGAALAGLLVVASGYVSSTYVNGMPPVLAWTPWVAWAADRLALAPDGPARLRSGLVLAACLALQITAGEPASILVAGWLAVALLAARSSGRARAAAALGAAGLAAVVLAAAAVLPAAAVLRESERAGGLADAVATAWSMHPARLAELVWPLALGDWNGRGWFGAVLVAGDVSWAPSLAFGAPALLLAVLGARERRLRWLALASLLFVLLALGRHSPVYALYRAAFPPERVVRHPEKYFFGAVVIWAALAGVGWTRLASGERSRAAIRAAWALLAATAAALGLALLFRGPLQGWIAALASDAHVTVDVSRGMGAALRGGALAACGAALFAAGMAVLPRRGALGRALLAAGCLGPPSAAAWSLQVLAPASLSLEVPALLAALEPPSRAQPPRVLVGPDPVDPSFDDGAAVAIRYRENVPTNVASRFGWSAVTGYDSARSERTRRLAEEVFPRMTWEAADTLLGIDAFVLDPRTAATTGLAPVATNAFGWRALVGSDVRPRAFVASTWRLAPSSAAALDDLAARGRRAEPGTVTLLASAAPPPPIAPPALSPCSVTSDRPEVIVLACESASGGYAVHLDELMPGWEAEVDGAPAPLLLADGIFRAVAVGPGRHQVVLRYRTPGLRTGIVVSALGWALLGALGAWSARRSARRREGSAAHPL